MNPCIDVTASIDHFEYGGMNRIKSRREDSSGKGINAAVVLKNMGVPVRAIGMNYTGNGAEFADRLSDQGLSYEAVFAEGKVRENIKLLDLEKSVTTEINQSGVPIDAEHLGQIREKIDEALNDESVTAFIMTGSLPPGTPVDFYRSVTERGNEKGIRMMLDAEGAFLLEGIKGKPYLIKPNLFEFVTAFSPKDTTLGSLVEVSRQIISSGVNTVCISLGADGALLVNAQDAFFCAGVPCEVKSTQGAGDSLLSGICAAIEEGKSPEEQLRYGVSCALGTVVREGTLLCRRQEFDRFYPVVKTERYESE